MGTKDAEAARSYHESTKHSERSLFQNRHTLDFDNQPIPFKIYPTLERLPLARDHPPLEVPALEAIAAPREAAAKEDPAEQVPDLTALSRVLHFSAGITKRKRYPGGETYFRAAPNTGALYHIDLYLVCGDLPDLAAGVYHFGPQDFALRLLRAGDFRSILVEATGEEPAVARAPAIVVSASTYWRNAWKYQARAYRHCFWDAGTLHANLLAVAATERLSPRVVVGFADAPVERLLGLDPEKEGALTVVPLGRTGAPAPKVGEPPELQLETTPVSKTEVNYPAIRQMHAASSLRSGAAAASWRDGRCARTFPAAEGSLHPLQPLAEREIPCESLESVIRRRGSTRVFGRGSSISLEQLATVLDRAGRELPADFLGPGCVSLLDLYLIIHAVEGIPAGCYYYRREHRALELLRAGEFRNEAGRLGLFQELPADAAVNLYSLTDLDAVGAALGNRGYRAAQLEGGIRGGQMYLAAYALRLGATGLTFLDEEVTDFFSPHARGKSVMFLTALGHSIRGAPRRER
jgi:SagB-type dehydrogenase family enzyme